MSIDEARVGTLEDEREITRILTLYNTLLDSREIDRIGTEVFAADAVADYNFDILQGSRAIVDYITDSMTQFKESAHLLSNVLLISCDGSRAEVTAAQTVWLWVSEANAQGVENWSDFANIFFTWDRLERKPEGWRVVEHRTRVRGASIALAAGPVAV
jgi:SnoaL-like domain